MPKDNKRRNRSQPYAVGDRLHPQQPSVSVGTLNNCMISNLIVGSAPKNESVTQAKAKPNRRERRKHLQAKWRKKKAEAKKAEAKKAEAMKAETKKAKAKAKAKKR